MLLDAWLGLLLFAPWLGDNILFEDNNKLVQTPIQPLNTEADVLKFIVRDFRKAAELLPETGTDHHPSKYAAKAALAKALLAQSGWEEGSTTDHQRNETTLKRGKETLR